MNPRPRPDGLIRTYVVTAGRYQPSRNTLDLVTLVTAVGDQPLTMPDPEKCRLVRLCRGGSLSIAEIAAHLELPVGVTKILVADLVDEGHLITRAPVPPSERLDIQLLEDVLRGLRALT